MRRIKPNLYGIKKRMLLFVLPLVLVPLIVANLVTYITLNNYIKSIIIEGLNNSNRTIFETYKDYVKTIDENTQRIMFYQSVQRSLEMDELSFGDQTNITKYLSLFMTNDMDSIYYIDNKDNIHTVKQCANESNIIDNAATKQLEGTYGEMKIAIDKDDGNHYLYISRYVRHLEFNLKPGMLILKMYPSLFDDVFTEELMVKNSHYLIVDNNGIIAYHNDSGLIGTPYRHSEFSHNKSQYILTKYTEDKTQWSIISYVSQRDVFSSYRKYQYIMYGMILLTAVVAIYLVIHLSKKFTKPIEDLTHAMLDFDSGHFNTRLVPTQYDEIGNAAHSFNHMADSMTQMLEDIELKQQELRRSELKTLVHQINPHLVYNTLDNVNMLLRMKGDDQTSNLIQLLSRFLRVSLSKGHMFITLHDEFEHGRYYLEIQSIRYSDLFTYSVDLEEEIRDCKISKFIIQPFLENCIKHGFSDRYEGGHIDLSGFVDGDYVVIQIKDNGIGIKPDVLDKLNALSAVDAMEIEELFPDSRGGYGIANVIARLRITYKDAFIVQYDSGQCGAICTIKIQRCALIHADHV